MLDWLRTPLQNVRPMSAQEWEELLFRERKSRTLAARRRKKKPASLLSQSRATIHSLSRRVQPILRPRI